MLDQSKAKNRKKKLYL